MDYKNVIAILSGVSSEEKIISTLEETENKKANVENTDPADTYRIVRTKKGKVYVQKNNPNKRGRPRGSKKFASSSGMVPMWPSLKDCKRPVSEVVQYLSDGPEGVSAVTAALAERAIETVGDLCSLSTSEVAGLPIKQLRETTVKWAMQGTLNVCWDRGC